MTLQRFDSSQTDALSLALGATLILIALAIYFLPAIIGRKKRAALAIFALNLLLGSTVVFWIIALVWALTPDPSPIVINNYQNAQRQIEPAQQPILAPGKRNIGMAIGVSLVAWALLSGLAWFTWRQGWLRSVVIGEATQPSATLAATGATPFPSPIESSANALSSPSPTPSLQADVTDSIESAKRELTAERVINALIESGLPIAGSVVYTEETDPNKLLGRPGQYKGKVSWRDQRDNQNSDGLEYTVEVFSSAEDLEKRRKYVEAISRSLSALAEYQFVHKNALLRLHHNLTPKQAAEYEKVLKSL